MSAHALTDAPTPRAPSPRWLAVESASVSFGSTRALHDVSLNVAPGEAVALVGPSGAGKSTLLALLGAARTPDQGRVLIHEADVATLGARRLRETRRRIGFVHQQLALVPGLRVAQNVLAGRLGHSGLLGALRMLLRPPRADLERAHALLERVGIPEKLFERTDTLSGGQQQRVAIARALFQSPDLLLADEPVASVDPARARDTVDLLTRISREDGLTLVISLHDLELAKQYFPRLVGMRAGRIVFDADPATVSADAFQALYALTDREMLADGA